MPRSKQFDRPVKWTLNIPRSTVDAIEGILHDPLYKKPLYAARGKIINQLLLEFIQDIQGGTRTFDPISQRISVRKDIPSEARRPSIASTSYTSPINPNEESKS